MNAFEAIFQNRRHVSSSTRLIQGTVCGLAMIGLYALIRVADFEACMDDAADWHDDVAATYHCIHLD